MKLVPSRCPKCGNLPENIHRSVHVEAVTAEGSLITGYAQIYDEFFKNSQAIEVVAYCDVCDDIWFAEMNQTPHEDTMRGIEIRAGSNKKETRR